MKKVVLPIMAAVMTTAMTMSPITVAAEQLPVGSGVKASTIVTSSDGTEITVYHAGEPVGMISIIDADSKIMKISAEYTRYEDGKNYAVLTAYSAAGGYRLSVSNPDALESIGFDGVIIGDQTLKVEDAAEKKITVFCDGTAAYKMEAEARDAGFSGSYYFAQYFGQDIRSGIKALAAAGKVTVNSYQLPTQKSAETVIANEGSYHFDINGETVVTADQTSASSVEDQAVTAVGDLLKKSGTQVSLTLGQNGNVEEMDVFSTAGALIDHVRSNADGTVTAYTDVTTPFRVTSGMGPKATVTDVTFDQKNVENITGGCIAVYWNAPDGWHLKAADAQKGYLINGADHQYYVLKKNDGSTITYQDAEMYSRGFGEGNRPGQYTNTQLKLGLTAVETTVWFIPGTLETDNPMPIGITSLENADTRLEKAISDVQAIIGHTVIAESAEDAQKQAQKLGYTDYDWVSKNVISEHQSQITGKAAPGIITMVNQKVADAQALLDNTSSSDADLDEAAYELYIAMYGSSSDIGAVFAGTAEEGFYDVADGGTKALPPAVVK